MHWRPFLAGSPHKVIIWSDHQNLTYWKDPQKLSRRIARQHLDLMEYNIEIRHLPGKANGRADALSRTPDYDTGANDNQDVIVIPEHVLVRATKIVEPPSMQNKETLIPWIDPHKLKKIEGLWYKEGRLVVTGDLQAKQSIIHRHHDAPAYGHPGINKTTNLVERAYWWPRMKNDIMDYVKGCADCQRNKVNLRPIKAPLQLIYPKPEATPFDTVAIDFITKLPESQGYDLILTITDHDCTKAAIFIPCNEEINAEGTAALYLKHVFIHFRLPSKIISDRNPRFTSKFTRELCKMLGIEQNISTVYHPRTDGQSERTNQWLETFLRFVTDYRQHDWATYLPIAQFAHNQWTSDTMRKSPFFLLMGYNPRADWRNATSPLPQVMMQVEQLQEARDHARALMTKAQQSWVKHRDTPKYKKGNLVWLEGKNLRLSQPTPKLAPRRHGPFKVMQVMSPVNYRLELPTQWNIHPVFHIDLLTPYRETITHGPNYQRPPPDLVDNEEEYEVEKILDSRLFGRRKRLQYLVKWAGYPDAENMWVDKDDVFAEDKIREFKNSNPESRTHIRRLQILKDSHHPPDSPSSSTGSYFLPHTLSMTSNVDDPFQSTTPPLSSIHDNLPASTPRTEAAAEFPDDHDSDHSICEAIRLLRIGSTPTESASKSDHRDLSIPVPNRLVRHEDAREWHWEQLLQAWLKRDLCNRERIQQGMIPITLSTSLTCDLAREDVALGSTATDIPPRHRCHHPYLSDLGETMPLAWSTLASAVKKPSRWSMTCPLSSKRSTKIPERFRQPTLPKGWVYDDEGTGDAVATPSSSSTYSEVLHHTRQQAARRISTRLQKKAPQPDSSETSGPLTFPSPSPTITGDRRPPISSSFT